MKTSLSNCFAFILCVLCIASPACAYPDAQSKKERRPSSKEVKKQDAQQTNADLQRAPFGAPSRLAILAEKQIDESSGLAASRLTHGIFWTHNDSGDGPFVYAFDREGKSRGTFRVAGARNTDWEDMAAAQINGRAFLYVGDIGDNSSRRAEIVVYRFPEPALASEAQSAVQATEPAEAIRLKYPDGAQDAETLMVHPASGDIYIVTKVGTGAAGIYRLRAAAATSAVNTLERVGEVSLPGLFGGFITGGDISPDGRRVVLCDYLAAYELSLPANDARATFDDVWKQPTLAIELGARGQGETICYGADGAAVYATSEKPPIPLIEVKRAD